MPIKRMKPKRVMPGIWQDGEERFRVEVWGKDERTRRRTVRRRVVIGTLADAVKCRDELAKEMETGQVARRPRRSRFRDYAEQWLAERSEGARYAESTKERFVMSLATLTTAFGDYWVDAMEPTDIRRWMNGAKCSPATTNGCLRVLRLLLGDAVMDGFAARNAAKEVRGLPEKRIPRGRRGRALSPEEFNRFLAAVERLKAEAGIAEDIARLLLLIAWTGVRKGEAFALRWSDYVDGVLRIERSVWKRSEKATKTNDPRVVPVSGPLAEVLEEQRRWLVATQHPALSTGLMFPASPNGARASATRRGADGLAWFRASSVLTAPLAKVVAEAKIPEISPHSFRRTMEDLRRLAGVDLLVRQANAGWRNERTQSIYATVRKAELAEGNAKVVRLLAETKG